ncbi:MAG TPA: hypothetical protein VEK34_13220 [Methylocella sp.]|nr:hypothetical protein [Methylocella sp.]
MIAVLGLVIPVLENLLAPLLSYLGVRQKAILATTQSALEANAEVTHDLINAQIQADQIKAANNSWIGAKIVACMAGELSVFYYGSIVLDSIFHLEWNISKLPAPWDQYTWIILSSFIIVSPIAPTLSVITARLTKNSN